MKKARYNFTFEFLQKMYCDEARSSSDIAIHCGCSNVAVLYNLRKYSIPVRRGGNIKGKPLPKRVSVTEELLQELYVEKRFSSDRIAEIIGCARPTILAKLRECGIRVRHHNELKKGVTNHRKVRVDHELITCLYEYSEMSLSEISKFLGIGPWVVKSHLMEYGVRVKTLSEVVTGKRGGAMNAHWNPLMTQSERESRRDTFKSNIWRGSVFLRDSYECQYCGDSTGGNLNAHHIESYGSNKEQRWVVENGITLCRTCHALFHHDYGNGKNTVEQFAEFMMCSAAA